MAESKIELIMQAIETLLKGITLGNGYDNEVRSVQRFEMGGNDFAAVPVILVGLEEENHKKRDQPNTVWETATISVEAYIRHSKSEDARSTDAILISLNADVYKAMMVDRTLGGLCFDLSRVSVFPHELEEPVPHVAHVSEFTVEYSHLINSVVN